MFTQMTSNDMITPDKFTYTTLIKGLVSAGDIEGGVKIFREVSERSGVQTRIRATTNPSQKNDPTLVDNVTYNTLIRELCLKNRIVEAKSLFEEMLENPNVKPNALTYGFLMKALLNNRKYSEVISTFEDCRRANLAKTIEIYTTAIVAAGNLGQGGALEYLHLMKIEDGLTPTIKTLTAVMDACDNPSTTIAIWEKIVSRKNGGEVSEPCGKSGFRTFGPPFF